MTWGFPSSPCLDNTAPKPFNDASVSRINSFVESGYPALEQTQDHILMYQNASWCSVVYLKGLGYNLVGCYSAFGLVLLFLTPHIDFDMTGPCKHCALLVKLLIKNLY